MSSETDPDLLLQDFYWSHVKLQQNETMGTDATEIKLPPSCINWHSSEKHSWEADNWTNNPYSRTAAAVVGSISLQNSCDKAGKREKTSLYTQM